MNENKISSKHYIVFIYAVTFICLKLYSSIFISIGGRETWICTAIAFTILILYTLYILQVICKSNVYNINEIFTLGLSKPIGNVFLFLFAIGLFLSSLEATIVEANSINSCFFNETPTWYIILFFILPSMFLIGKKLKTIVIFTIIMVAGFIANCLFLNVLTEQYKNIQYILPVFGNNFSISSFFNCIILILGCISSFSITLPYLKNLQKEDHIKRHSLIALLIIGLYCVYSIIGIISIFGPLRAANLFYPEFTAAQRVEVGGFLDFGELFFLMENILGLFLKYLLSSYGIYIIYKKSIKNHKVFITIYSLTIFILGTLLSRNNYILFEILKYFNYISFVLLFIVPLIAITCFSLRSAKNK